MSTSRSIEALAPANEDTILCYFYSDTIESEILSWKQLCSEINETIEAMSKDYIWQRDVFKVYLPIIESENTGGVNHLCSTTCFGDNIEDEWFIVHLVLEISKKFTNLIIEISDNDGDLLLIEAAEYLPNWINPSNMENRVFIYYGHIHIVPPELAPLDDELELETALKIITESSKLTQASTDIQQAILKRIGNYPEKLLENIHRAVVQLPSNLAALLILKPPLIAPLVDAYCNHDMIDIKHCKNIEFTDCVDIEVKFTKYLYAILTHSKLINSVKCLQSGNDKKRILGLKLMCGFQMISSQASSDIYSTKEYHKFLNSLKSNGYFKSNIEGSKEYRQLLENAKEYFSLIECPISTSVSHKISQIMDSDEYIRVKDSLKQDYAVGPEHTGDSEDWLNINPEQLNEMLLDRYGRATSLKNNDVLTNQSVTNELSTFLKQTSDFEGIEPDHNEQDDDNTIDFESDQFVSCIEKMLNILSTGGDVDNLNDSDDDITYEDSDYDIELKEKLERDRTENLYDKETIVANIVKSMKEEKASTGPTSNLLRSVGFNKSELLDSDDDVD